MSVGIRRWPLRRPGRGRCCSTAKSVPFRAGRVHDCGGCPLSETNGEDCYGNPAPVCGECFWAQGIVLCP